MSVRLLAAALLAWPLAGAAGCGDSGDEAPQPSPTVITVPEPSRLSPAEAAVIRRAQDAVSRHCRQVAEALAEGDSLPAPQRAIAKLEPLAELAGRKPAAEGRFGVTPRLALGDIAENLEGTNCDPRLVAWIDAALAELP